MFQKIAFFKDRIGIQKYAVSRTASNWVLESPVSSVLKNSQFFQKVEKMTFFKNRDGIWKSPPGWLDGPDGIQFG